LFEFLRNDLFNATPYFGVVDAKGNKKPGTLKRHQFGGTAGGPVVKNKLFFFGGWYDSFSDPADNQAFVPTTAMLAGDFTTVVANSGRTFVGRLTLTDRRLSSPATRSTHRCLTNLAKRLPAQNTADL
jgi:hypothetical protein